MVVVPPALRSMFAPGMLIVPVTRMLPRNERFPVNALAAVRLPATVVVPPAFERIFVEMPVPLIVSGPESVVTPVVSRLLRLLPA